MGIIVTAIAVSPLLRVGGMQIFRIESSDRSEKVLPRAAQIAGHIGVIYLVMTTLLTGALYAAGLGVFDATVHSMTTIATGGFSTMDGSVGEFRNPTVEWIIIAGMIAGSLPFVLYIQMLRGRGTRLLADSPGKGLSRHTPRIDSGADGGPCGRELRRAVSLRSDRSPSMPPPT